MIEGLVIKSTGSWYEVKTSENTIVKSRLRGKFKKSNLKLTNPIAVGDYVVLEREDSGTGFIVEIKKRKNYIIRKSSRNNHFSHLIASNIDLAVLVISLKSPKTSFGFIDRFVVAAESYKIPVLLVINKIDLLNEKDFILAEDIKNIYESIHYNVIKCSVKNQYNLLVVKESLKNKVCLVNGHSGVGKSSLINAIYPEMNLRIGEISSFTNKGTHTTTHAEMYEVEKNTFIIDTPGIKEFALEGIAKNELSHYYLEFLNVLSKCKFHNCLHVNEPSCRVKEAVETNKISTSRYNNYLQILSELD